MKWTKLFSLLLFSFAASGQSLTFNRYTPAEGLVDTRVQKIFQDSRGIMYFLTRDGFSTFDGQRFQNYSQYQNFSLNIVSDILEEKNGRIIIVAITGIYFLQNNKLEKDSALFTPSAGPGSIYLTNTGEKIISSNSGLMLYKNSKGLPLEIIKNDGTRQPFIIDKAILKDDLLVTVYSNPKVSRQYLMLYNWKQQKAIAEISSETGFDIQQYHDKIYVWLNLTWMELNKEELNKGKLITQPLSFLKFIPAEKKMNNFFIDAQKKIWLITADKQVCVIDPEKKGTTCYSASDGLPESVSSIFQDKENNYWFTVAGKGVYKMTQSRIEKILFPSKSNPHIILPYINQSPEGIISFKYNNNLGVLNENNFSEKKINVKPGIIQAFTWNNKAWTLYNNGKLEGESGDAIQLVSFVPGTKAISSRLTFDREGRLLVAGNYFSLVNKDLSFTTMELPYYTDNIACDDKNNYWCLTRTGEILGYQMLNNRLVLQTTYKETEFSSRYMLHWNKDTFCIGTRNMGVVFVKINNREYRKLGNTGTEKGISNNFIVDIIRLSSQKMLVANVSGLDLVHLNKPDTTVEQLFSRVGLFTGVTSIRQVNDSTVMALAESGEAYWVHVTSTALHTVSSFLYFSQITVNGRETDSSSKNYRFSENNFRFAVSAPSFIDEKNIRFVFSLKGPGTDAVQNSKQADFEYSNLQPGNYTLTVTAFFPGDTPVNKSIQYDFIIKKPFWKTTGFIAGLTAFILLLIYAFFKNILRRKLLSQKVEMEKQQAIERERNRISRDMHDDLGSGLTKIAILSEVAKKQLPEPEKAKEQLEKISESSRELVDNLQDIIWVLNPKNDTLENLSSYIREYALKYFEPLAVKLQFNYPEQFLTGHLSEEKRRNVFLTVKESLHNIAKHAWCNQITISILEQAKCFEIIIEDDGRGFDTGKVRLFANGLKNMQTRIEQVGGTYLIQSETGKGTLTKIKMTV